ncbi:MAG: MarR family winged helix-turn-helix transcriptional regulator [Beijerinckiaceae bacterium]
MVKTKDTAKVKLVDPVGNALTLAARRHRVRSAALLSELGLFPGQDQVLRALASENDLTMGQIAEMLSIRPPTASKMISRMELQGLLLRKDKDGDARLVAVAISEEGLKRSMEIDRISKKLEKEALAGLDDKDMRRLRRLLKKVSKNLGQEIPDTDASDAADSEE